ncbi:HsdM family class I SAM-dependent methyltransferase [Miniphocaeibacter halophilus]|uniref:N-6 DNA methylase n=1 Tax=Miniphocaeibacter halophilus TaxID=2931922 RepID=A0AC61MUP5_9FIRM|nr:N-6 DNA methylase [Miniphocaeibacter halophilus]QQK09013.1 N-6 DNA methylase [Miniphocaeibacter halophilus]
MDRYEIINRIGAEFLKSNIENGEFSYAKALKNIGKNHIDYMSDDAKRKYKDIDLRFVEGNLTILVETKQHITNGNLLGDMEQLQHYVYFEKELTGNKVIAILAATQTNEIMVWQDGSDIIDDVHYDRSQRVIKSMEEYKNIHFGTRNDKISLVENTNELNELLHQYGINEGIRSQFVGTCLLALKYDLAYDYPRVTSGQIREGIQEILEDLLDGDLNKARKLVILKDNVIDSQDVRDLKVDEFQHILRDIENKIIPYINEKSTMGQDLLNLFFTTFNKYVGKADKNQAFTPDHIVHFMCNVIGINRHSIVLDPCCGSGAFLVRAMTEAMDDCDTDEERENIKKNQIFGIEFEEKAYGLSTTNMLIHGDGNSNVLQGSCFDLLDDVVEKTKINTILMNPPYNAQRKHSNPKYVETWKTTTKQDPSKGFHFVYEAAKKIKTGKLAVLLPTQCAIGNSGDVKLFKRKMLEEHTLDAVFSLPIDIFHPGASASACCMIFNLGMRHENSPIKETFFGYFKDDGYEKRKNLGRMEREDGLWRKIEEEWLTLYFNRESKAGMSVTKKVKANDEWLAEAYMQTDYDKLSYNDFQKNINNYLSYLVKIGEIYEE